MHQVLKQYFALYLQNPIQVITTFIISLVTYYIVFLMSKYLLIYGRRRVILSLLIAFLIGLATTLTRSMMIGFFDVLPVYILMAIAIFMMLYEGFFDKK